MHAVNYPCPGWDKHIFLAEVELARCHSVRGDSSTRDHTTLPASRCSSCRISGSRLAAMRRRNENVSPAAAETVCAADRVHEKKKEYVLFEEVTASGVIGFRATTI